MKQSLCFYLKLCFIIKLTSLHSSFTLLWSCCHNCLLSQEAGLTLIPMKSYGVFHGHFSFSLTEAWACQAERPVASFLLFVHGLWSQNKAATVYAFTALRSVTICRFVETEVALVSKLPSVVILPTILANICDVEEMECNNSFSALAKKASMMEKRNLI